MLCLEGSDEFSDGGRFGVESSLGTSAEYQSHKILAYLRVVYVPVCDDVCTPRKKSKKIGAET